MIVIHSDVLSAMPGFRVKMFYCQPDMTSSSVLRQSTLHTLFHDGFGKSDHDLQLMIHSNFLSEMHCSRDNEVLFQAGYDVIVISRPVGSSRYFT